MKSINLYGETAMRSFNMNKLWRIDAGRHGFHIREKNDKHPLNGDLIATVYDIRVADEIVNAHNAKIEARKLTA